MCIAIYKPANEIISKASLQRCFDSNPDGAGFMFAEEEKLHVHKGYFTFKSFYKAYKKHETKQALVHFRIKTHGKTDKENCHPILVNSGLGFIHNGIISGYGDDKLSDTIQFNNAILKKIVKKHGSMGLFDDPMVELIENVIGYSKLVFLDKKGNFNIMNEDKGHWYNKVWYSNSSYKKPEPTPSYPTTWKNWGQGRQDTLFASPSAANSLVVAGDWVEVKEDIMQGTGDNTHIIKKGDWLEVQSVEGTTCTLLDDDLQHPIVYSDIPCDSVESYDRVNDTKDIEEWNSGFYGS